ncbi:glucose-fructose oxidoreductase domain-containing protein 2-like [Diadema antillarum]|uniref:glucose-fructose oxidoreductase domain-containing protein 2-like n=1 Tax=Diadema antillarum TaxID=105358 RepID=UPI003A85C6D9
MMLEGVGVVGTGSLTSILINTLQAVGIKVVALWGPTDQEAREVARQYRIPFHTSKVDEVLLHQEVDLVWVTCPPHLHGEVASKALGIGKHVLCERPAGLKQADALKMVTAAQYYPSLVSIMTHGLRFLPAFVRTKRMIQEGEIGEVFLCDVRLSCGSLLTDKFNWMCDENMGGGLLNTLGSHIIDIISFLIGQRATKVRGMLKTFIKQNDRINGIRHITSDDFCTFQMELSRGACATVTLNAHFPGQFRQEIMVIGSEGRLLIKDADLYGQTSSHTRETLIMADIQHVPERQKYSMAPTPELPLPYYKGLLKLTDALKESFERKKERLNWDGEPVAFAATFEDALYVQTVLDAIRQSHISGNWESIELLTDESKGRNFFLS